MTEEHCPCEDITREELLAWATANRIHALTDSPGTFAGEGRIPKALGQYWTRGEGAAKIGWGTDGAFKRCERLLAAKVKDMGIDIGGLCANLHKRATGEWPAERGVES